MSSVSFSKTKDGVITFIAHKTGRGYQVLPTQPIYRQAIELLAQDDNEDALVALFTAPITTVKSGNGVTISNGSVLYNGEKVHSLVARRILEFAQEGLPMQPLVNFLDKVMQNPSMTAQQELYDFLENKNLPITEDGDFLAYKAINDNWTDIYTGRISNKIGATVAMDRKKVDDNRGNHCSKGLHCGAMDYVAQYGGGNSRIVIVKVNPADAVSVPSDHSFMKLRVCKYLVLQEYQGDLIRPLYTSAGVPVGSENYDDAWDDENFDWDEDEDGDDYYEDGDDYYEDGDVTSSEEVEESCEDCNCNYHNKRDRFGRFSK